MPRIGDAFGYRREDKRQYVDVALFTIALALLIGGVIEIFSPIGSFDFYLGLGCLLIAVACIASTSSPLGAVIAILLFVVVRGVLGLFETRNPIALVAVVVGGVPLGVIYWWTRRTSRPPE